MADKFIAPTIKSAIADQFVACLEYDWNSAAFIEALDPVFDLLDDRTLRDPCLAMIRRYKRELANNDDLRKTITNNHELAADLALHFMKTDEAIANWGHVFG